MTQATILVAPRADDNCLIQVVDALTHRGIAAEAGVLDGRPPIEDALAACVQREAERIAVLPFLFREDEQVFRRLRQRVQRFHDDHANTEIHVAPAVGFDARLVEIAQDYIDQTVSGLHNDAGAPLMTVDGCLPGPMVFTYADLRRVSDQIEDVGHVIPGRRGSAVSVADLLRGAGVSAGARHAVFHSADDGYYARVSLATAVEHGILVYRIGDHPLPERMGGPLRLFVPETDDRCANVKNVVRIELVR
ncbi:MAG: molybdopterin-dependent oxidoreductase [Gemmatimonadetes bacterium]|nr:molybdopterin-dependent oxidoreductase [Gemmatimonadota bacterium]MDE3259964.1 molybdopterin-dependent oxidoreductase [Gemmatimonadota bacterium]